MNFFKKVFLKKKSIEDKKAINDKRNPVSHTSVITSQDIEVSDNSGAILKVSNNWGIGDGSPFFIYEKPDLNKVFDVSDPDIPQKLTENNQQYWKKASLETKQNALARAYFQHPDADVRLKLIDFVTDIDTGGVDDGLVDLLVDIDKSVCKAAAKSLWIRQKKYACQFAVHALRDEIRGHINSLSGTTTQGLNIGREKAIQALDLLVAQSPDKESKKRIQDLIRKDVIIEDRVDSFDPSSVKYLGTQENVGDGGSIFTYEVYRADSKQEALAFLKTKKVNKELYYIEVETPEGNFGRDIDGMYDI